MAEVKETIKTLADSMIARFTPPEFWPGCQVVDVTDKDEYTTDNGYIEAIVGPHGQQRVRYQGFPPNAGTSNFFVDVEFFPAYHLYKVFGTGEGGTAKTGGYKVDKVFTPDLSGTVLYGDNGGTANFPGNVAITGNITSVGSITASGSINLTNSTNVQGTGSSNPDLGASASANRWGSIFMASAEIINALNSFDLTVGSIGSDITMITLTDAAQDVLDLGDVAGTGDVDIDFSNGQMFLEGSSGFLGIGTTTPNFTLHLHEASAGAISMQMTNTDTGTTTGDGFIFGLNASEEVRFLNQENTDMSFSTNATARFYIKSNGNFGFRTAAQFGSGVGVLGIANATSNPSTNPTAGGVLYADAGAGKWRGSGGTTTTFGPAEPHCPVCGLDFVLEWENDKTGHLIICVNCLAKELGDKLWIIREEAHA